MDKKKEKKMIRKRITLYVVSYALVVFALYLVLKYVFKIDGFWL